MEEQLFELIYCVRVSWRLGLRLLLRLFCFRSETLNEGGGVKRLEGAWNLSVEIVLVPQLPPHFQESIKPQVLPQVSVAELHLAFGTLCQLHSCLATPVVYLLFSLDLGP